MCLNTAENIHSHNISSDVTTFSDYVTFPPQGKMKSHCENDFSCYVAKVVKGMYKTGKGLAGSSIVVQPHNVKQCQTTLFISGCINLS